MFQDFFPGSIHSRTGCKDAAIEIPFRIGNARARGGRESSVS